MRFDVAIIGAGIAGASLAWSLGRQSQGNLRVALIEMEAQPGYHTTGRSAAFWVESYGGPGIVPLSRASRRFFDAPPPGFCDRPLLSQRSALVIAAPDAGAALDAEAAAFAAEAIPYHWLDAAAMATNPAGPMLRDGWRERGILQPDCFDIDVAGLHQGYLRGIDGWKPQIITDAEVRSLVPGANGWTISTRGGEFKAKTVVNAAGAWADKVAGLAGARPIGLQPMRRTMAVLDIDPPPRADLPVVMDAEGRFYFKPDGGRLWLSPHDEIPDVAHDVRPDEIDLATVIARFEQVSPVRVVRLASSWAGLRTFAPDRLPVFGWDDAVDGFFWCAGQGGFGIQTAPAVSQLCAALLLGQEPAVSAISYSAARLSITA